MKYFDLHCDTPLRCYDENLLFDDRRLAVNSGAASYFDEWKQCFAVWIRDDLPEPFTYYKNVLNGFKQKIKNAPKNLIPIFTVEGGAVIEGDISRLSILKEDGIRALTLTWNGKNRMASGCAETGGLTPFGRDAIAELDRLKIASDVSHLNEQSFWDVIKIAEHPIATHSNCDAVFHHRRNLSDEQLKAIAAKGGIIGVSCYPEFLGDGVFDGFYANIRHLMRLGLEDHIAFGSDFDGAKMSQKLDGPCKIPHLLSCLLQKGIKETQINKIFYKNPEKFFVCL